MAERFSARGLAWLLLALLAACGQKGPLYLPDDARGNVTRPAPSTAPGEKQQSPSTPATPEVTPPDDDKDKKDQGAKPPRS